MEILYYLASICLTVVILLGFYDGFYLHLWKYELFNQRDSIYEHKTHTARAILFPLIIWLLFLSTSIINFWFGIMFVLLDLIILGIDAYSEKDSRKFMGGLPRQEYLIHLFVNGFHFAVIFLFLAIKIEVTESNLSILTSLEQSSGSQIFNFVSTQAIPGSILFAIVHLLLLSPKAKEYWGKLRKGIRLVKKN